MRHILLAAAIALALPASAQTKAQEKHLKAVVAKAHALELDKCEINDGTKGWLYPNDEPVGKLPLYRCFAHAGHAYATFTQSPDGSDPREFVEYCAVANMSKVCETVVGDRPRHRIADLVKFGLKGHQMGEIQCEYASIGTIPLTKCEPPHEKAQVIARKR